MIYVTRFHYDLFPCGVDLLLLLNLQIRANRTHTPGCSHGGASGTGASMPGYRPGTRGGPRRDLCETKRPVSVCTAYLWLRPKIHSQSLKTIRSFSQNLARRSTINIPNHPNLRLQLIPHEAVKEMFLLPTPPWTSWTVIDHHNCHRCVFRRSKKATFECSAWPLMAKLDLRPLFVVPCGTL